MLTIEDLFGDLKTLETERLILRKMTMDDAADMFEYASDPEVTRHSTWNTHQTLHDTRQFLQYMIANYEAKQVSSWGIEHKRDGKFIGTGGFIYWRPEHNRSEIGYALSRAYWNQGLMSEAVAAMVRFGFEEMGLNRLEARCNVDNIGSERVMQKVGMTYEGTIREQLLVRGHYESVKLYSILRSEVKHVQSSR